MSEIYVANEDVLTHEELRYVEIDRQSKRIVIVRKYPFLGKAKVVKLLLTFEEAEELEGSLSEALNKYKEDV